MQLAEKCCLAPLTHLDLKCLLGVRGEEKPPPWGTRSQRSLRPLSGRRIKDAAGQTCEPFSSPPGSSLEESKLRGGSGERDKAAAVQASGGTEPQSKAGLRTWVCPTRPATTCSQEDKSLLDLLLTTVCTAGSQPPRPVLQMAGGNCGFHFPAEGLLENCRKLLRVIPEQHRLLNYRLQLFQGCLDIRGLVSDTVFTSFVFNW